jgi:ribose 5-phosphate isomerase B
MTAGVGPKDQSDGGGEERGASASVAQQGETILIAADHAGFEEKEILKRQLTKLGFKYEDLGASASISDDDYPDYAHPLARKISRGEAKRGILLCGSGIGVDIVANRYPNVRAALSWMPEIAELSRRHNDSNVLVIPSRFVSTDQAVELMKRWLATPFEGGRHMRRVEKIDDLGDEGESNARS